MDTFLDNENFYQRLLTNYKEHDKIIIAYDFDDTVKTCRGKDCSMIIELIKKFRPYAYLICFTAREIEELDMVEDYLITNEIPYDYINKEWNGKELVGRKMYYNIFLDDKCGMSVAYNSLVRLLNDIKNEKEICYD